MVIEKEEEHDQGNDRMIFSKDFQGKMDQAHHDDEDDDYYYYYGYVMQ